MLLVEEYAETDIRLQKWPAKTVTAESLNPRQ
jgi:hypothetical protein